MGDRPPQNDPHKTDNPLLPINAEALTELPREELLRLYQEERNARIASERRVDSVLRENSMARRTAALRDYMMASAHCLLWYSDIYETDAHYLNWVMEFPNIETARRFLPIEVK